MLFKMNDLQQVIIKEDKKRQGNQIITIVYANFVESPHQQQNNIQRVINITINLKTLIVHPSNLFAQINIIKNIIARVPNHQIITNRKSQYNIREMTEPVVTWAEFEKHIYSYDCWIMVEEKVYNVTDFMVEHPGGDDILVKNSGKDATAAFNGLPHSEYAVSVRNARLVGRIQSSDPPLGYLDQIADKKKQVKDVQKRKIIRRDDTISWQEVALHKSAENCWIVIDGKVYDPTYYLDEHPGGANKIMEWAGQDATKGFKEAKHSMDAIIKTDQFYVGQVESKVNYTLVVVILLVVMGAAAIFWG